MMNSFKWVRSLPAQLVGLLSLALLPLGLISVMQSEDLFEEARLLNKANLKSLTKEIALAESALIKEAFGAAQAIGSVVKFTQVERCRRIMNDFVDVHPQFLFAGYTETDGFMRCSTADAEIDLREDQRFRDAMAAPDRQISYRAAGTLFENPAVVANEPVYEGEQLLGFVSVVFPHALATRLIPAPDQTTDLRLVTVTIDGTLLATSVAEESASDYLPRDIAPETFVGRSDTTFEAVANNGTTRVYSIQSAVPGTVALVGSWLPGSSMGGLSSANPLLLLAFPVLMWIAGIGVAYFGVQRLVIRHIAKLRSAMRKYALGELQGGRLELDNPPEELKDTERAFNRMVLFLAQADAQQHQDLRDKEVLLKEVHHRVKNNLQLIASIMNMQSRSAQTGEARHMLAGLQRRVRGLAMLHRTLYTSPDTTTIDSREMIASLVQDLVGSLLDNRKVTVETDLLSAHLYPDQAVPLSMLLAEALTNAVKYAGIPEGEDTAWIKVTTREIENEQIELIMQNSRGTRLAEDIAPGNEPNGLGIRLMKAFVSQLEGRDSVEETEDVYTYRLAFTPRDFEPPAHVS